MHAVEYVAIKGERLHCPLRSLPKCILMRTSLEVLGFSLLALKVSYGCNEGETSVQLSKFSLVTLGENLNGGVAVDFISACGKRMYFQKRTKEHFEQYEQHGWHDNRVRVRGRGDGTVVEVIEGLGGKKQVGNATLWQFLHLWWRPPQPAWPLLVTDETGWSGSFLLSRALSTRSDHKKDKSTFQRGSGLLPFWFKLLAVTTPVKFQSVNSVLLVRSFISGAALVVDSNSRIISNGSRSKD